VGKRISDVVIRQPPPTTTTGIKRTKPFGKLFAGTVFLYSL